MIRYLLAGSFTFFLDFSLFWIFLHLLTIPPLYVSGIVYSFLFWVSFIVQKYWAFQSYGQFKKHLIKYFLLFCVNLSLSSVYFFLYFSFFSLFAVGFENLPALLGKVCSTATVVVGNYFIYKNWIFKDKKRKNS